jgi:hypothetical protein
MALPVSQTRCENNERIFLNESELNRLQRMAGDRLLQDVFTTFDRRRRLHDDCNYYGIW